MKTSDLFDLQALQEREKDWPLEVFKRAYTRLSDAGPLGAIMGEAPGPFDRVLDRLRLGYSAFVKLPGNCMIAAASVVRDQIKTGEWEEHGRSTKDDVEFSKIWGRVPGVFQRIFAWLAQQQSRVPHVIVHNLDDLADNNGLIHHENVWSAFNALREATRLGVVFGMADRESTRLPERLLQLFQEKTELGSIDENRFLNIVPQSLGRWFATDGKVNQAALRLVARRLRYMDPIRAVLAMDQTGMKAERWKPDQAGGRILDELWKTTQALGYIIPEDSIAVSTEEGFEEATVETLKHIANRYAHVRKTCLKPPAENGEAGDLESEFKTLQKGVLLYGPTGTGKTHLARWLARELQLPIRIITADDVRASDWGRAEQLVHGIFREARRAAPCVLMFDEADDLFRARDQVQGSVAGAERAVVAATLQELDGVFGPLDGVLVLMTTNLEQSMDKAIHSRLTRRLLIPYPLTPGQVAQIVDNIAKTLRLDLSEQITPTDKWFDDFGFRSKHRDLSVSVRDVLIERFYGSLGNSPKDPDTVAGRRAATYGLFAPRDIREAMSELINPDNRAGERFVVKREDVERVFASYAPNRISSPYNNTKSETI